MIPPVVEHAFRSLRARVQNALRRAVVRLLVDSEGLQRVQLESLRGYVTGDRVEVCHPYGFTSNALGGADPPEAIVLGLDSDHLVALPPFDRTARPLDTAAGEVVLYHREGHRVRLQANGVVRLESGGNSITVRPSSLTAIGDLLLVGDLQVTGDAQFDGDVVVTGTVTAADFVVAGGPPSLKTHVHGGVTSGGSSTGPPV